MAADTSFSLLTGNSIETRRVRAGGVIFREGEQSTWQMLTIWVIMVWMIGSAMATFPVNLVSPEKLLFSDQVDQVDLPGVEGDFGVLAGHTPIVAMLRPGIVTIISGTVRDRFVVLGGLAEFSGNELTILADSASSTDEFDLSGFKAQIEQMQADLAKKSVGDELDSAIALLDHYKAIHVDLAPTTAF